VPARFADDYGAARARPRPARSRGAGEHQPGDDSPATAQASPPASVPSPSPTSRGRSPRLPPRRESAPQASPAWASWTWWATCSTSPLGEVEAASRARVRSRATARPPCGRAPWPPGREPSIMGDRRTVHAQGLSPVPGKRTRHAPSRKPNDRDGAANACSWPPGTPRGLRGLPLPLAARRAPGPIRCPRGPA
jgi:hypothetical protein